jgi:kumamolisin
MSDVFHVALSGSDRPACKCAKILRPSKPTLKIELTVIIRRMRPLPAAKAGVIIPVEQLRKIYGSSDADMDFTTRVFSEEWGLAVTRVDPPSCSMTVSGTVAQIEKTFAVRLHQFKSGSLRFRGYTGQIHVPSHLDGVVKAVFGFDTRPVTSRVKKLAGALDAGGGNGSGLMASDLETIYDFPPDTGRPTNIAIVEFECGYVLGDLQNYLQNGPPPPTVNTLDEGGTQFTDTCPAATEVMLDVELTAALCPSATISVYFATNDESGYEAVFRTLTMAHPLPDIVSVSYGEMEDACLAGDPRFTQAGIQIIEGYLSFLANAGTTVCVASGDTGSSCGSQSDSNAHVLFPASSPHVLSVGGTEMVLTPGPVLVAENTWEPTGGGVSTVFDRPVGQLQIPIQTVNPGDKNGRIVPDVAALAGSPQYQIYVQGGWNLSGGTSAAAPIWASLIHRIIQNLTPGMYLPFVTPLLYQKGNSGMPIGQQCCNAMLGGSNQSGNASGYASDTPFSACTGWGSPKGCALLQALSAFAQPKTAPSPSPT